MVISVGSTTFVNSADRFSTQNNARVQALADGGYVVAWETNNTTDQVPKIVAQRFNSAGVAQTGVVTLMDVAGALTLSDIAISGAGRILIGAFVEGSSTAHVGQFDGATLALLGPLTAMTATTLVTNVSVLAMPSGPGNIAVYIDSATTPTSTASASSTQRAVVSSAGLITTAPTTVQTEATRVITRDVIQTSMGEVGVRDNGELISAAGTSVLITNSSSTELGGLIELEPGVLLLASNVFGATSSSMSVNALYSLAGIPATNIGQLVLSPADNASIGQTAGLANSISDMFNLGGGRVLIIWSQTSSGGVTADVFASVYNVTTGTPETTVSLFQSVSASAQHTISLGHRYSATVLADGRVVVSMTTGAAGLDGERVFTTIIDPRFAVTPPAVQLFEGTAAADILIGSLGNDTFNGIGGGDTIFGGAGVDTVIFNSGGARVVDLAYENSPLDVSVNLVGIENLTGSSTNDRFMGAAAANILLGGGGNDTIEGRAGSDTIGGDAGNDSLGGGSGNDQMLGGTGNDYMSAGTGNDLMLGEDGEDVVLAGAGDDHAFGGLGNDRLFGQSGDDSIYGDDGNDIISGGAGDDYISGDAGNDRIDATEGVDTIFGGLGNDVILIDSTTGEVDGGAGIDTVTIFLRTEGSETATSQGFYLDLNNDMERLFNSNSVTLLPTIFNGVENATGSGFGDAIYGDGAANVLRGQGGDDTIQGRGGADALYGGSGSDVFVFADAVSGADVIRDYVVGQDKIRLVEDGFDDISAMNLASRLTINATAVAAASASAQLIFDNSGSGAGRLFFDADGNGAGAAVLFATLTMQTSDLALFSAADFVFV